MHGTVPGLHLKLCGDGFLEREERLGTRVVTSDPVVHHDVEAEEGHRRFVVELPADLRAPRLVIRSRRRNELVGVALQEPAIAWAERHHPHCAVHRVEPLEAGLRGGQTPDLAEPNLFLRPHREGVGQQFVERADEPARQALAGCLEAAHQLEAPAALLPGEEGPVELAEAQRERHQVRARRRQAPHRDARKRAEPFGHHPRFDAVERPEGRQQVVPPRAPGLVCDE